MTGAVLDVRDGRSTVYFGNEEARARRYAQRAEEALAGTTGAVEAVEGAEAEALSAIGLSRSGALTDIDSAKDTAQGTIASQGAAIIADATTQKDLALGYAQSLGTIAFRALDDKIGAHTYSPIWVQSSAPTTAGAGTAGERWRALDAGTDIAVDRVIDGIRADMAVHATATHVQVRVYECNTADPNVNLGPPQAGDTLVADRIVPLGSIIPLDGGGAFTAGGTTGRDVVIPLAIGVVIKVSKTYKVAVRALDGSGSPVAIAFGARTITSPGRLRFNGGSRTTVNAAAFTASAATYSASIGVVQRNMVDSGDLSAALVATGTAFTRASQERLASQLQANDALLTSSAANFPKAITDDVTFNGDSQVMNNTATGVTAGNKGSDNAALYYSATSNNNIAVAGTITDQIVSTFLALAPSRYDDYGLTNGGRTTSVTGGLLSIRR